MLVEADTKKLNISGGESFLEVEFLGEIIRFSKVKLARGLQSTGIICNGSKITKRWLDKYGQHLDIVGGIVRFLRHRKLKDWEERKWERGTYKGVSGGGLVQGSRNHVQVELGGTAQLGGRYELWDR